MIIDILWEKILAKKDLVEGFFDNYFKTHKAVLHNSVDLRNAGFKIAPVDTNCFPAGFNNLSKSSQILAKARVENFLADNNYQDLTKIIIIPENHTRNLRYLENILALQEIFTKSGREVRIASLGESQEIDLENNKTIKLEKIDNLTNWAQLAILNNDFTNGIPQIINNLQIPIRPNPKFGWYIRSKSHHFDIYNDLAQELAQVLEIDPWLISTMHHFCADVNFKEQKGIDCLAKYVDEMILNLKEKYREYNINQDPYCFIKADSGTYGIAVWSVSSGKEVLDINKKERNKMNMLKGSVQNTKVMVQEGVPTIETIDNQPAEPLIYGINGKVVANLFRSNENRDSKKSLNTTGMKFLDRENLDDKSKAVYNLVARLAYLACAIENSKL